MKITEIKDGHVYEMQHPYFFNKGIDGDIDNGFNESMLSQKGITRVKVTDRDRGDGVVEFEAANESDNDVPGQRGLARPEFLSPGDR